MVWNCVFHPVYFFKYSITHSCFVLILPLRSGFTVLKTAPIRV